MLINEATRSFIEAHADDDVRTLALKGCRQPGVDMAMALQQIDGRQRACRKLPSWAAVDGIVYPPHLSMEQCSSEHTARYKAALVARWSAQGTCRHLCDLTGGFGVDFSFMAQAITEDNATPPAPAVPAVAPLSQAVVPPAPAIVPPAPIYVEQSADLCAISTENFRLLGVHCSVCCGHAAALLPTLPQTDLLYLDPARRDTHGARTYGIADCTPDVIALMPQLLQKARRVLLKLSPMLDWRKAVSDVNRAATGAAVTEVHIVSIDNECKELLLVVEHSTAADATTAPQPLRVFCANNGDVFEYVPDAPLSPLSSPASVPDGSPSGSAAPQPPLPAPPAYLYEPNASIMKAGCFREVEARYSVRQIAENSHLFLASEEVRDFPGRCFQISAISSLNKKELKGKLGDAANIAVRNFPLTAEQLRKKLKLKDGGKHYLFATTLADGQHRLLICVKPGAA